MMADFQSVQPETACAVEAPALCGEAAAASPRQRYALLAVDPGTTESGWCLFDGRRVLDSGTLPNGAMLEHIRAAGVDRLAIEMIDCLGMPVGREVFETCLWIGRMVQSWRDPDAVRLVYRREVKLHLCGTARAKDANIRQALIDRLGPVGVKKAPGPLYGVKSHAWAALAVALTATEVKA